jgi:hypothetical protein
MDIAKVMQMPTKRDDQAKESQNVGTKNEKPNHSNLWTFDRRREMSVIPKERMLPLNFNPKQPTCALTVNNKLSKIQKKNLRPSRNLLSFVARFCPSSCSLT